MNLSSYCGLVDAKIRASDKDLPLLSMTFEGAVIDQTKWTLLNTLGLACEWPLNDDENGKVLAQI